MSGKQDRLLWSTLLLLALLLTACPASTPPGAAPADAEDAAAAAADGPVTIEWWSHWANQPANRAVIEQIAADYEVEHPNVEIEVTWWDKNPLRDAIRSAMTAGEGAPDITTFDSPQVEWVEAGWVLPLTDVLPWENFIEGTQLDGAYPSLGYPDNYKFNIGATVNMLFYNPQIFEELGIEVPEDRQFTEDEFLEVVQTCSDAGYAGVADAIGNRPYPGVYPAQYALFNLVGPEEYEQYDAGLKSWDTPEARRALEYTAELRDAGLWPESFSTMTIDEFHTYFHTLQRACMFYIPTWYTGRAFQPEDSGGQSPDFQFGMLLYPEMEGAAAPDTVMNTYESGYAVLSSTEHPDIAKDILAFAAQPQYGALWTTVTDIPSAIQYDPESDRPAEEVLAGLEVEVEPGKWAWYWDEFNSVYGPAPKALVGTVARCGDFDAAVVAALNEGLPLGLIDVDQAVEMLDAALCTEE